MSRDGSHALGYEAVDDDPNVSVLVANMDATARWTATQQLRRWEQDQVRLRDRERLLDVGCGLGEAALALATGLSDEGDVVGVDRSIAMLRVAKARARDASCRVRFSVGDACALAEPDDAFDVVRSERTLQWIPDPSTAVAEMTRVVRPGGLVSLIDTDWSTFSVDVGHSGIAARIRRAMQHERNRPSNVGARLHELATATGLDVLARDRATQNWTSWNPDDSPAPDGCFSMESLADDLVDADELAPGDRGRLVAAIHDAARRGRFSMSLTMYAVVARAPRA